MMNKIFLLLLFLFCSCASHKKQGNYFFGNTNYWIRIQITNPNNIEIKENNGGILSLCTGTYESLSTNKIRFFCNDIRGDSINMGSIINIIPPEYNVNDDVRITKKGLIFEKKLLKRE